MRNYKKSFYVIFLLIIMMCSLAGCTGDSKKKKDYSNIVENPNISIPGYERLELTAGSKKQSVDFYNPKSNTCYFKMSLIYSNDGTDEVLWTSDYVEPGDEIKSIKLKKELQKGDYKATLKYECFSLKDESPLNGSNVELTIHVR